MSGPLELAWMLLKANMPPFVPRKIDDQLGIGSYRAAYRLPGVGHTTKYGTGEKVADTMINYGLAERHPEAFVSEQLHALPVRESDLPAFTMQARPSQVDDPNWLNNGRLSYSEPYMADEFFDYGADGGHEVMPLTYTQELGQPIDSGDKWGELTPHVDLRDKVRSMYPLAGALGVGDTKPENWAVMEGGLDLPELSTAGTVKVIDPMFDYPRRRPFYTPEFMREAKRFQQDLPELREFAEPWYKGLDQYEDPALAERMMDTIVHNEQQNLQNILSPLNP
jgi:hypothetical protein